jgi:hypothetical protein
MLKAIGHQAGEQASSHLGHHANTTFCSGDVNSQGSDPHVTERFVEIPRKRKPREHKAQKYAKKKR